MKDLMIFSKPEFGEIGVIELENEPWFLAKEITNILGYVNQSDAIKDNVDKDECKVLTFKAFRSQLPALWNKNDFSNKVLINESGIYSLILSSKLPTAKKFKHWVTSEVLPSIRKNGAYMTDNVLEKAISDPDFMIGLLNNLKEEKAKRLAAEEKVLHQGQIIQHKTEIIEGLVEEIPLADMRQRINQIIRKGGVSEINRWWHLLYDEFNRKYHINIYTRMNNCNYTGSKLDFVEKELHMIPELYDLTCKLFENSYKDLMKSWGKSAKRAARYRNN